MNCMITLIDDDDDDGDDDDDDYSEKQLGKSYLVPHAYMELGLVYKNLKMISESRASIEKAKSTKSKYLLEALIQLKAHGALKQLDAMESQIV